MNAPLGLATKWLVGINLIFGLLFFSDQMWQYAMIIGGLFPGRFTVGDGGYAGFMLPVWFTPISHAFLHGGWAHLLMNMMMLLMTGKMIERVYGPVLFVLLYGAGMVLAAITEIVASSYAIYGAADPFTPVVGASGAISALIAANMILFPNKQHRTIGPIPVHVVRGVTLMTGWVAFNALFGFIAGNLGVGVAVWSHIGGFAAGVLLAIPLIRWRFRKA